MAPQIFACFTYLFIAITIFCAFVSPSESLKAKVKDQTYTFSLANYSGLNSESSTKEIILHSNTEVGFVITNIPLKASFLVVQAHSHIYNVSMIQLGEARPLLGKNLGFVYTVTALQLPVFYIANNNPENITILLAVIGYTTNAPVPGGCNMEFETKVAPYLHMSSSNALITIESQPALYKKCSQPFFVHYEFYHMYQQTSSFTQDSYFLAITSMMSPLDVVKNGRLVEASPLMTPMRRLFSAYHGTGSVYVVLARAYGSSISAAYIPTHTYACNTNPCVDTVPMWTILPLLLAIWGCILNVYGHGYFKTSLFSHGFLTSTILLYIYSGAENEAVMPLLSGNFLVFFVVGLICGRLWVWIWNLFGHPFTSTLLSALILASLLFSILLYTPWGDLMLLQSDIYLSLAFLCVLSLTLCVSSLSPLLINSLSCSLLGSYFIVLALDYYLPTNIEYIILNPIRRLSIEGFNQATLDPPVQKLDLLLFTTWGVFTLMGVVSQRLYLQRHPSYPPPYVATPSESDTRSLLAGTSCQNYSEPQGYTRSWQYQQDPPSYQQGPPAHQQRYQ